MINSLNKKIKKMHGNILCIGVKEENIFKTIMQNKNIIDCDRIDNIKNKTKKEQKEITALSLKTVNIYKLKKIYKKTELNYIICNTNDTLEYSEYIFKDSVQLVKNKCIFYGNIYNLEDIKDKLKRYDCEIEISEDKDLFMITLSNIKVTTFKASYYFIIDKIEKRAEKISKIFNS